MFNLKEKEMELLERFSGIIPPHNVNDVRKIVRVIVRDLKFFRMDVNTDFKDVADGDGHPRFSPDEAKLLNFLMQLCREKMEYKNASLSDMIQSETLEAIGGVK